MRFCSSRHPSTHAHMFVYIYIFTYVYASTYIHIHIYTRQEGACCTWWNCHFKQYPIASTPGEDCGANFRLCTPKKLQIRSSGPVLLREPKTAQ